MKSFNDAPESDAHHAREPFNVRWPGWRAFLRTFTVRQAWWFLLDYLESHAPLRIWVYGSLTLLAALVGGGLWAYPHWNEYRTLKQARQWLATGHYRYAVEAAQDAMIAAPHSPEPWLIAAELARLGGQSDKALEYARRAAELAPTDADVLVNWAAAAMRAEKLPEVGQALDRLPSETQAASPHVQRLRGELARRQQHLSEAQVFFEDAIRLEGPLAVNETPLGIVLLHATDPAIRERGLTLLTKWTSDREWGATALRMLLADAQTRSDRGATARYAEALRTHPGCTVNDMPLCLLALAQTDEPHFRSVLAQLEKDHAVSPKAAAELLSWLNQIGRGQEAVAWIKTLPPAAMHRPPLVVIVAESLRLTSDWPALAEWTKTHDWGADVEFLRWTYALLAARKLSDQATTATLWDTLYSDAQRNSVHALFAASSMFSWGLTTEAEKLWWRAAEQEGQIAIDALGSLVRHYQLQRDADGQYRAFHRLYLLRSHDAAIGNNLAFFAALTGREQRNADTISKQNWEREPRNPIYAATRAFVLFTQNTAPKALDLLNTFPQEDRKNPAVTFAYGLALAKTGQQPEARRLLEALPPETLTFQEIDLIRKSLAD